MKKMTLTNSTQNKLLQERINAVEKQNTAMKLEMNRLNVEVGSCQNFKRSFSFLSVVKPSLFVILTRPDLNIKTIHF